MIDVETVERLVATKMELSGLMDEGCEGMCKAILTRLYTAVDLWRLLLPFEKEQLKEWHALFAADFRVNLFLKELKRQNNKEKKAPAPHRKEKNKKEKVQKTTYTTKEGAANMEARQKAFWETLLTYEGKYDREMLLKFFYYWAEEVKGTNLMFWETKNRFNLRYRLAAWTKKSYQIDDKAADLRLERAKGRKPAAPAANTEAQRQQAAEREAADARREEETAKSKAGSISMEEYLKKNPNSILRTLKKK